MVGSTAFLLLLIVCAAPGNAELGALDEFGTVGSSVLLRGVPIDRDTAYDLKKGNIIIVAYHGSAKVRGEYAQRGNFSSNNGTFLLWDLRREDSGIYEHWVNSTVRRKSNLRVIEKVNEPILSREDLQADNGRCLVKLLCTAWGEGPFNVSFLRDEKDVNQNITRKDNVTILVIDSWDPDSAGSYTCNSSNPVSWNMAETITVVLSTATHWKLIAAVVITVLSPRWCFFVVILIIKYIKREKDMEQADQHICKSRYTFQAIIQAEFLLGFLWELAAAVICLIGHFFPNPWKYIPVGLFSVLVLCRILCYQEKCTHSYIKCTSSFITQLSDVLFLPGFYVYILIISNNSSPCGLGIWDRGRWGLAVIMYGLLWCALSAAFYIYIRKNKKKGDCESPEVKSLLVLNTTNGAIRDIEEGRQTSHVPEGDTGEPVENVAPEHVEHQTETTVETPNESLESPAVSSNCRGPMDTDGGSMDTDRGPGEHSSMILELKDKVLDKDRVANG